MTWKLTAFGETRLALPGVPWRELSDEEFATACERYPELPERGYFESVGDGEPPSAPEPPKPKRSRRSRR